MFGLVLELSLLSFNYYPHLGKFVDDINEKYRFILLFSCHQTMTADKFCISKNTTWIKVVKVLRLGDNLYKLPLIN